MTTGIILLNFGEPATPDENRVASYLERIFRSNAAIEDRRSKEAARERARTLAERRAPGLVEEYDAIDGSPLNRQSVDQATALEAELRERGFEDVDTYVGMQYTEPSIEDAVTRARIDGVDTLVGLPVYPIPGPSTTISALRELSEVADETDWEGEVVSLTDWHRHPSYSRLRTDNLRSFVVEHGLDIEDGTTELVYSAHGTPRHYLDEGSHYVNRVEEWCELVAERLGVESYTLGYQNHQNRDAEWTEPDIENAIGTVDADRIVVEPISFMHEQSETLWELDIELRRVANESGLAFHRVPIPHDDDRFPVVLADLVEPFLAGVDPEGHQLRPCTYTELTNAWCRSCQKAP